jgi:hypothetical protein
MVVVEAARDALTGEVIRERTGPASRGILLTNLAATQLLFRQTGQPISERIRVSNQSGRE